jgi:hypothetical protein
MLHLLHAKKESVMYKIDSILVSLLLFHALHIICVIQKNVHLRFDQSDFIINEAFIMLTLFQIQAKKVQHVLVSASLASIQTYTLTFFLFRTHPACMYDLHPVSAYTTNQMIICTNTDVLVQP